MSDENEPSPPGALKAIIDRVMASPPRPPRGGETVNYHHVKPDETGWMFIAIISRVGDDDSGAPGENPEMRCTLHVLDPDNDLRPMFIVRRAPFGPSCEPGSWWWR